MGIFGVLAFPILSDIGIWGWVIIGIVAVLLFGNRLPELGRTLGKGLVSFRKGVSEMKDEIAGAVSEPIKPDAEVAKKAAVAEEESLAPAGTATLVLLSAGNSKIDVIKAVREITGLGLVEAKDLVDNTPSTLQNHLSEADANKLKELLQEVGAEAEVRV